MAGVIFSHPSPVVGKLQLRLPPTEVNYTYKLSTVVTQTHGGEVVQVLGMNFDSLILTGQFGEEGAHGMDIVNSKSGSKKADRATNTYSNLNKGRGLNPGQPYQIGLVQMTEYFRLYFTVAGQGGLETVRQNLITENHNQQPMTIQYQSDLEQVMRRWTGYPISLPSYSRSNEEFAPLWQLTFEVEEADEIVYNKGVPAEVSRLQALTGYTAFNPFSDPLGATIRNADGTVNRGKAINLAKSELEKLSTTTQDELQSILDASVGDIQEMVQNQVTRPYTTPDDSSNYSPNVTQTTTTPKT